MALTVEKGVQQIFAIYTQEKICLLLSYTIFKRTGKAFFKVFLQRIRHSLLFISRQSKREKRISREYIRARTSKSESTINLNVLIRIPYVEIVEYSISRDFTVEQGYSKQKSLLRRNEYVFSQVGLFLKIPVRQFFRVFLEYFQITFATSFSLSFIIYYFLLFFVSSFSSLSKLLERKTGIYLRDQICL